MLLRPIAMLVAVAALAHVSPTASALLIDSFVDAGGSDHSVVVNHPATSGGPVLRGPGLVGVVGGYRSIRAFGVTYNSPGTSGRRLEAVVRDDGSNAFTVETGTRAAGFGEAKWDAGGAGLGGGLGVDISDGGTSNAISFEYDTDVSGQGGNVCYTLTLNSPGKTFSVTIASSATSSAGDTGTYTLNDFVVGGGVDLTKITSILLDVEAKLFGADTNVQFLQSTSVPEPSGLALLVIGACVTGAVRLRRRRNKVVAE